MQTLTVEQENTRVAYDDAPVHRIDRTPGHMPLPLSPFTEPEQIAAALQFVQDGKWMIGQEYIGGLGDVVCASNKENHAVEILWKDARGGWWIQVEVLHGIWLPALDKTQELAEKSRKPVKTCHMHTGSLTSDFGCKCGRCAVDRAATRGWEVNVKMRCKDCGNRNSHCDCNK